MDGLWHGSRRQAATLWRESGWLQGQSCSSHTWKSEPHPFLYCETVMTLMIWWFWNAAASWEQRWDLWPPEERNLIQGQRQGLITRSFLCSKVLLKYKRDSEIFWHRQQKGTEWPLLAFSKKLYAYSVQFSSVSQSCPTLCDPVNHSAPGLPVRHQLPKSTQTHVHQVSDAIQPSHPLSSPSPPSPNPSQHQGLFQWVSSLHQVAKVLEFQLQHQSFQWTPRTDFL